MGSDSFDQFARLAAGCRSRRSVLRAGLLALAGTLLGTGRSTAQQVCNEPFILCDGECHYSLTSNQHCGVCDNACVDTVCIEGTCQTCESNSLTTCVDDIGGNLYCADLSSSFIDCGECGNICTTGPCVDGACVSTQDCETGLTECYGVCVDLQTNVGHCGSCRHDCMGIPPEGQSSIGECIAGVCHIVCLEGYSLCDGACVEGDCESGDGGSEEEPTTLPGTGTGEAGSTDHTALIATMTLAGAGAAIAAVKAKHSQSSAGSRSE